MHVPRSCARPAPCLSLIRALLCTGAVLLAWSAGAAAQTPSPAPAQATPGKPTSARVAQAQPRPETRPAWSDLGAEQRAALQPLAGSWSTLSEAQKRKWIALSQNFARMSPQERATLHSRMTDWVALSPQQRTQARLNFGETRDLSPDDKKAKWEAYQALSAEEKRRLAAGAQTRTPPTAPAVKPVPAERLANVPRAEGSPKPPRIDPRTGADAPGQRPPARNN